jgi:hypothetical protein
MNMLLLINECDNDELQFNLLIYRRFICYVVIHVFMFFDMVYILWPSGQIGSIEFENKAKAIHAFML